MATKTNLTASNLDEGKILKEGDAMDHRRARERAWLVGIFTLGLLEGEISSANPNYVPALSTYNGPYSIPAIIISLVIEFLFLLKIPGFTWKRSLAAVLFMNAISAIPGFFFSLVFNEELAQFILHHGQSLYEFIGRYDDFNLGPGHHVVLPALLFSFPVMLLLDVLIEGTVLWKIFKMNWDRRNIVILTAANTISLVVVYAGIISNSFLWL